MSDSGLTEIHSVRPVRMSAWTFVLREQTEHGPPAGELEINHSSLDATIRIGDVPFEVRRDGRAHDLLFADQPLARAEQAEGYTYDLAVEMGFLASGAASGTRELFSLRAIAFSQSRRLLREGQTVGEVTRQALLSRHYSLRFRPEIPLVLRGFCFTLLMAQLLRQG